MPQAALMAAMASSERSPRPSKAWPSTSNSGLSEPTPTPAMTRPLLKTSSVPSRFTSSRGWWYGSTAMWVNKPTFEVWAAKKPSVENGSKYRPPRTVEAAAGMAMCSEHATQS